MLYQLKELLEMQRVLDEAILKEYGNVYDKKIAEQMRIALFVELGEMMNELPSYFKHWKKSAKDNRDKALVEYVDCLHFAMSLFNYNKCDINLVIDYNNVHNHTIKYSDVTLSDAMIWCVSKKYENGLMSLFDIGNYLGFTWEEIYKAYKDKNAINYERLKNGY